MTHQFTDCWHTSWPGEPTSNLLELLYANFTWDLLEFLGQRLLPIPKREVPCDIGCDLQLFVCQRSINCQVHLQGKS